MAAAAQQFAREQRIDGVVFGEENFETAGKVRRPLRHATACGRPEGVVRDIRFAVSRIGLSL